MFSKLKCIFPVASSPFQKISCMTVGSCMTIGGSYLMIVGAHKYVSRNTTDKIMEYIPSTNNSYIKTAISCVTSPVTKSNNPYTFGLSFPILGLYGYGSYMFSKWWYNDIKQSMVCVKNANQCCKLIRMSMYGTLVHSGLMLMFVSNIVVLGVGIYTTGLNGYSIILK